MKTETVQKLRRIELALRQATGQNPLFAYLADDIASIFLTESGEHGLSELEVSLIRSQNVIVAIKEYRARTGAVLKDAKVAIEAAGVKMGLRTADGHWTFKFVTP